jgi:hypothetical protein
MENEGAAQLVQSATSAPHPHGSSPQSAHVSAAGGACSQAEHPRDSHPPLDGQRGPRHTSRQAHPAEITASTAKAANGRGKRMAKSATRGKCNTSGDLFALSARCVRIIQIIRLIPRFCHAAAMGTGFAALYSDAPRGPVLAPSTHGLINGPKEKGPAGQSLPSPVLPVSPAYPFIRLWMTRQNELRTLYHAN